MYLYGIDVSSNQPAGICKRVDYDFAIVKAGGNPHGYRWDYVNPYAQQQLDDAFRKCGRVGAYWFLYGLSDAKKEADKFVQTVKSLGYLGKCLLVADYEADALARGKKWLLKFCKRVEAKAGYKPIIYASGSVIASQGLKGCGFELWCANYSLGNKKIDGYDTRGCTPYVASRLWQFTDAGVLDGYGGTLDLNRFDGSAKDWTRLSGQKKARKKKYTTYMVKVNTALNFRKGAGTGYAVTRTLGNGKAVKVDRIENGWAHTDKGDWCCARYLEKKG